VTIGYSFRDYDALARLRSAMSFNSGLRLVLVAPDAKAVTGALPLEAERLTRIERLFGGPDTISEVGRVLESNTLAALP